MITLDELKSKLGGFETSINDLRDALAIEASEKRLAELEHQMTLPGFYDDQEKSQKVYAEMSDLKGKLDRFKKLNAQYEDAGTMLEMLAEENDPGLIPEGEEAVNAVEKAVDELQLMTMLNGEYDANNAILTFHAGTGGHRGPGLGRDALPHVHPLGRRPRLQGGGHGRAGRRRGRHQERLDDGQGPQRLRYAEKRERRPPPGAHQPL